VLGDAGNGERLRVHLSAFDVGRVVGAKRRRRRVRRRWWGVVLTRARVVRAWFGNGGFGVGESARVDLFVVLFVPDKGKRGWGLLTLGCLDLSH
jgi:hypothetical protein